MSFTRGEVVAEAGRRYGKPVCMDRMNDALREDTLEGAVMVVLTDSVMWDSPRGDPFDKKIWAKIKM